MTTARKFTSLTTDEMRSVLTADLAEWRAAEFKDPSFRRVWFRRVAILARRTNQRRAAVITQISEAVA